MLKTSQNKGGRLDLVTVRDVLTFIQRDLGRVPGLRRAAAAVRLAARDVDRVERLSAAITAPELATVTREPATVTRFLPPASLPLRELQHPLHHRAARTRQLFNNSKVIGIWDHNAFGFDTGGRPLGGEIQAVA